MSRGEPYTSKYQHNYTYIAPLALAQEVPLSLRPTLEWWGQATEQLPHIVNNRQHGAKSRSSARTGARRRHSTPLARKAFNWNQQVCEFPTARLYRPGP